VKLRAAVAIPVLLALAMTGSSAWCDSPVAPPKTEKIYSANRAFFVLVEPATKLATVYEVKGGGQPQKRWLMPTTFGIPASLSDDGRYLVALVGNLIGLQHDRNETLVWFYDRGRLVAKLSLADLIEEDKLQRTVSHYAWANSWGFASGHRFQIETVDGRVHVFDVTTGEPAS
jgi:hypothetical protein